ncbi:Crp/Fnr family transcriptional regulator [Thiohalorhabdus methylotrophus]|uniref:Crp/Fnr family transcriptional regulator n=1 Tax=Thiohalorhabdus methylotrophus TaxID=3242694 RepID=A0ABV4TR94_9GAMM
MTENEKRLLAALEQLPEEQQEQLVDYAEFLVARSGGATAGSGEAAPSLPEAPEPPQDVEKDPEEGPVQAIKRLRHTYPMLERSKLLDETTSVMAKRYLQDKPEGEVIEELEALFERHYRWYVQQFEAE